jgi:hypothetical protein
MGSSIDAASGIPDILFATWTALTLRGAKPMTERTTTA